MKKWGPGGLKKGGSVHITTPDILNNTSRIQVVIIIKHSSFSDILIL